MGGTVDKWNCTSTTRKQIVCAQEMTNCSAGCAGNSAGEGRRGGGQAWKESGDQMLTQGQSSQQIYF